jgi:hypothetical protein
VGAGHGSDRLIDNPPIAGLRARRRAPCGWHGHSPPYHFPGHAGFNDVVIAAGMTGPWVGPRPLFLLAWTALDERHAPPGMAGTRKRNEGGSTRRDCGIRVIDSVQPTASGYRFSGATDGACRALSSRGETAPFILPLPCYRLLREADAGAGIWDKGSHTITRLNRSREAMWRTRTMPAGPQPWRTPPPAHS